MLAPWLEVPGVAPALQRAAEVTGVDLVRHGTTSDADTIRDTAVAQPLLVASALASLRAVLGSSELTAGWTEVAAGRLGAVGGH